MSLVPANKLNNTSLVYLHQISFRSQLIYTVTLLAVIISLASLPFINTTVTVKGNGAIQSAATKIELVSPINGIVTQVRLVDNTHVIKVTVLLKIDPALPDKQKILVNDQEELLRGQLIDILSRKLIILSFRQRHSGGRRNA